MIRDHFVHLVVLAAILAAFLGTLFRDDPRSRARLAAKLFAALAGGAVAAGWLLLLVR